MSIDPWYNVFSFHLQWWVQGYPHCHGDRNTDISKSVTLGDEFNATEVKISLEPGQGRRHHISRVRKQAKGLLATLLLTAPEYMCVDVFSFRVQSVKPTQVNVKYNLWRGRVHCTLASDDDVAIDDIMMMSLGKPSKRTLAFGGISADSFLKARVVKIKEQQITRYFIYTRSSFTHLISCSWLRRLTIIIITTCKSTLS